MFLTQIFATSSTDLCTTDFAQASLRLNPHPDIAALEGSLDYFGNGLSCIARSFLLIFGQRRNCCTDCALPVINPGLSQGGIGFPTNSRIRSYFGDALELVKDLAALDITIFVSYQKSRRCSSVLNIVILFGCCELSSVFVFIYHIFDYICFPST